MPKVVLKKKSLQQYYCSKFEPLKRADSPLNKSLTTFSFVYQFHA